MVFIACEKITPRMEYVAEIIFKHILQTEYKLVPFPEIKAYIFKYPADAFIFYASFIEYFDSITIPVEGLVFEDTLDENTPLFLNTESGFELRFTGKDFSDYTFNFDVFSSCFYWITQYEMMAKPVFDSHGRYDEKSAITFKENLLSIPWVHHWAEELWKVLKMRTPLIYRKHRDFNYTITVDVDDPYLSKGKPLIRNLASTFRDTLKFRFNAVASRISSMVTSKDRYDTYEELINILPKEKLIFFFLTSKNSRYDGYYTLKNKWLINLISSINKRGVSVGIHPSYSCMEKPGRILREVDHMNKALNLNVSSSRMHYLRYRFPNTYRELELAGIRNEYSKCPVITTGFLTGMAVAYPWFDLHKNEKTTLMVHPTMAMDRSLQKYLKLSPDLAYERLCDDIAMTKKYHGHFNILIHNNTISETGDWHGWKNTFLEIFRHLETETE